MGPKVLVWNGLGGEKGRRKIPLRFYFLRPSMDKFNVPATEEWNPEDSHIEIAAGS